MQRDKSIEGNSFAISFQQSPAPIKIVQQNHGQILNNSQNANTIVSPSSQQWKIKQDVNLQQNPLHFDNRPRKINLQFDNRVTVKNEANSPFSPPPKQFRAFQSAEHKSIHDNNQQLSINGLNPMRPMQMEFNNHHQNNKRAEQS